jgi:uncharacterized protein (DUF305 family)
MIVGLASATAVSALSQGQQGHAGHNQDAGKMAAGAPYDLQFLDSMTMHHQHGLEMAKMAQERASHAELKAFAQKMVEDHQTEIDQMKRWRDQWYAGKPEAVNMNLPGMAHNMDMVKLQAASGHEFDMMFLDMMIPHHQGAIDMSRDALKKASHQEIKTFARQIISKQQKDKAQMTRWKSAWAGAGQGKADPHGQHKGSGSKKP